MWLLFLPVTSSKEYKTTSASLQKRSEKYPVSKGLIKCGIT